MVTAGLEPATSALSRLRSTSELCHQKNGGRYWDRTSATIHIVISRFQRGALPNSANLPLNSSPELAGSTVLLAHLAPPVTIMDGAPPGVCHRTEWQSPRLSCGLLYSMHRIEFKWSERPDLNRRPPDPKSGALPGCATLRVNGCGRRSRTFVAAAYEAARPYHQTSRHKKNWQG